MNIHFDPANELFQIDGITEEIRTHLGLALELVLISFGGYENSTEKTFEETKLEILEMETRHSWQVRCEGFESIELAKAKGIVEEQMVIARDLMGKIQQSSTTLLVTEEDLVIILSGFGIVERIVLDEGFGHSLISSYNKNPKKFGTYSDHIQSQDPASFFKSHPTILSNLAIEAINALGLQPTQFHI